MLGVTPIVVALFDDIRQGCCVAVPDLPQGIAFIVLLSSPYVFGAVLASSVLAYLGDVAGRLHWTLYLLGPAAASAIVSTLYVDPSLYDNIGLGFMLIAVTPSFVFLTAHAIGTSIARASGDA